MNAIEEKLIDAYAILIMAGKKTIEDTPIVLHDEIKTRIAEKTIEILEV